MPIEHGEGVDIKENCFGNLGPLLALYPQGCGYKMKNTSYSCRNGKMKEIFLFGRKCMSDVSEIGVDNNIRKSDLSR